LDDNSQLPDALLTQAAEALFRLGRLFSRIGIPASSVGSTARRVELSRILVVQAIDTVQRETEQEITVGVIAQQLAVEPSTASRLVADAIKDGYITRGISSTDNRRVQLDLTDSGRTLIREVRKYQQDVFEQLTHDWTESERAEFARLFVQFSGAVVELLQTQARREVGNHQEQ
jgi:DNA-binding MarR family transcriptional regulator